MKAYLDRLSDRALEMVMRDVLDGLEEIAINQAMHSEIGTCRVLSIEPMCKQPGQNPFSRRLRGEVVDFLSYKKAAGLS